MTIKELNDSLTENQRVNLINQVAIKGEVSISSVYRWMKGDVQPRYLYRELIKRAYKAVTGKPIEEEITWD